MLLCKVLPQCVIYNSVSNNIKLWNNKGAFAKDGTLSVLFSRSIVNRVLLDFKFEFRIHQVFHKNLLLWESVFFISQLVLNVARKHEIRMDVLFEV